MKSEAVLSGAGLNDARLLGRNPPGTAVRTLRNDFWQRTRALFDRVLRLSSRPPRRLRLCESLPRGNAVLWRSSSLKAHAFWSAEPQRLWYCWPACKILVPALFKHRKIELNYPKERCVEAPTIRCNGRVPDLAFIHRVGRRGSPPSCFRTQLERPGGSQRFGALEHRRSADALLTLLPALVVALTPFARLLIVFHFLRQALGTQTAPSNQTLIGLSLVLTYFLMQPVGAAIYQARSRALPAGAD